MKQKFIQAGWDMPAQPLTQHVDRMYINDDGVKVTVFKPTACPTPGRNTDRGDVAYEMIGQILGDCDNA